MMNITKVMSLVKVKKIKVASNHTNQVMNNMLFLHLLIKMIIKINVTKNNFKMKIMRNCKILMMKMQNNKQN